MSNPMAITEWARVKSILKEVAKTALEKEGHTWDSFKELGRDAAKQMVDEVVETEYGFVQRTPKGPIQWVARKAEELEPEWQLTLLQRREK